MLAISSIAGRSHAEIVAHEQLPEGTRFLSKPYRRER
jgi:hypothetical protein